MTEAPVKMGDKYFHYKSISLDPFFYLDPFLIFYGYQAVCCIIIEGSELTGRQAV